MRCLSLFFPHLQCCLKNNQADVGVAENGSRRVGDRSAPIVTSVSRYRLKARSQTIRNHKRGNQVRQIKTYNWFCEFNYAKKHFLDIRPDRLLGDASAHGHWFVGCDHNRHRCSRPLLHRSSRSQMGSLCRSQSRPYHSR